MGTTRQKFALVLAALLTLGGIVLATTPTPVAADGGGALPGAQQAAATRISTGDVHTCVVVTKPASSAGSVLCWGNNAFGQLGHGDTVTRGDGPDEMGNSLPLTDLGAPVVSLAAGGGHTCAILAGGAVKCWGYNSNGQLGLGDTADRGDGAGEMGGNLPAVALGTGRTATMLAAGLEFTCALLDDGTVKCWGDNAAGQLGLGDAADRGDGGGEMGDNLAVVPLGTGRTAIAVTAGAGHACALLDDRTIKCWGVNDLGQLGRGDTTWIGDGPGELGDALAPVDLGQGIRALAVSAGRHHTCALIGVNSLKCWGANTSGQLGQGDTTDRGDGAGEMGANLPVVTIADVPAPGLTQLIAYGASTCVAGPTFGVRCWGSNNRGQLNAGMSGDALVPAYSDVIPHVALAGGFEHLCWFNASGSAKCVGRNDFGQLGQGDTTDRGLDPSSTDPDAIVLRRTSDVVAVAAGSAHTCVIIDEGRVRCVGKNFNGELGVGDTVDRGRTLATNGDSIPTVDLGTGRTAVQIDADFGNTCAILDNGALKCWGRNQFGMLGVGDTETRGDGPGEMGDNLPAVPLGTGRTAVKVSVGRNNICAILDNGALKCWGAGGSGANGQGSAADLGDQPGELGDNLPPIDLGTGRTAIDVSAGFGTVCAVLDNHALKCWGYTGFGSAGPSADFLIGDAPGDMGDNLAPLALGTGRTALQVSTWRTTCAVLDNHTLKCWGMNEFGEAGRGDTTSFGTSAADMGDNLPVVQLGTGRTVVQVSVGESKTCALLDNATAKCWGAGTGAQLGVGSTDSYGDGTGGMGDLLPSVILPDLTPLAIVSGGSHGCVLVAGAKARCWGANGSGQIGVASTDGMMGQTTFLMAALPFLDPGGAINLVTVPPTSPGFPTDLTAAPANGAAVLDWSTPYSDGGSPILGYRVQQSSDDGVNWTTVVANSASTATDATIPGLTNGVPYRFRVAAINAKGVSPASIDVGMVPATVPDAPTNVVAVPGDGQVSLTWTAPAGNGRKILGYVVEQSTNNGATWAVAASPSFAGTTITGLANFVGVRFRVTASNVIGAGPASAASAVVTPVTTRYWPLRPARLADTRTGTSTVDGTFRGTGLTKAGGVLALKVVGRGGVPAGSKAVTLNVTVVKPLAAGSISVYPCGSVRSAATTMTFAAGATVANTVVAKVGTNGSVCIWTSARTHVVVDASGVHPAGDTYLPVNPQRLASTATVAAGKVLPVKVTGRAGVPATAKSATLNVTVLQPTAAGKVTVYACGTTRPALPTIVFKAGARTSNMTVSRIGTGGAVCVHSSANVKVHVDVLGAHPTSTTYKAVTPVRLASKALAAKGVLTVVAGGKAGVPSGARAVTVNITVSKAAAAGSLTVYPCGTRPVATNTAFVAGTAVAQTVVTGLAANGTLCVYTSAAATVTVDVTGNL